MKKVEIGKSGIHVAPLCLGGNVFGWTIDEKRSFEVLDAFVSEGFNFIDTADIYATWAGKGGESETVIGRWMKARKKRSSVVIATKVGKEMGPGMSGLSRKYIRKAVEASLKRLQTDYIDLYQSHTDDTATPLEETMRAFGDLIREGKVKAAGASNYSAERLLEALRVSEKAGVQRYECLQPHYNLCERPLFESALEKVCIENKLGVIPYYSLASGFLTGKYRRKDDASKSVRGGGAIRYLNDRGNRILDALDDIARSHHATPAAVSLAWLIARPSVTAPIASATSVSQVSEIARAASLQLTKEEVARLDRASG
jgi:aryl-alcohol dehydrogenase-like predicted oxidoreductase